MKTLVFSLAVLGVIVFSSWEYAPAPCCPPPPTTTGVLRIVSGFNRVTLPSPTRTTPRPLTTAKFGSSGERPSWVTPFTCSTVRSASSAPQASGVPITRDPHPSSFGSDPITRDPHPSSFSSAPAEDYLCASYFGWEDWWCANNVYLLNVQPAADKAYVSTLDASKDVPDLLALSCYRGNFEKGIQEIAFGALRDLGDPAMDVIIGIADGRVNIGKDLKLGRFSQDEYAEAAIRALGYLGGAKTEEVLIRILKDKSMNKRFWACGALGRLGNPANIPALENSLATDSDKFVRAAAAEAIARIGGASAIASLRRGVDPNKDCYQARAYITASQGVLAAADPVEVIRIAAASEEGNIRAAAAIGLACVIRRRLDLGHDCTELVALYTANLDNKKDADVRVTMAIASLLIGIRPTLHELFRKYLTDDRDPGIRAAFALAYALSGDIASLPYLTALPVDSDPMVETARGYALACLTTPDRAKVLKDLVASPSPVLAACGLVMLAKTSDGRDAIAALRRSTQVVVRRMVAFYLVQIPPAGGDEDIMSRISASDRAAKVVALVALGLPGDAAAVSALKTWSGTSDKELLKVVNIGMALAGWRLSADGITPALSNENFKVRCAAVVSLGQLNRPELLEAILSRIETDPSYRVRAYACAALANVTIPPPDVDRVVNTLVKAAKTDREYMVRGYAAFMLSMFKENRAAFEAVRGVLADRNSDVLAMAAFSLGLFGNPEAAKGLRALLQKGRGTPIADSARIGLGLLGDESISADLVADFAFLNEPYMLDRAASAIAMGADRNTCTDMLNYLDYPSIYVRESSIMCLGMLRNLTDEARAKCIEKLAVFENDRDGAVRFHAAIVRTAMGDRKALKTALSSLHDRDFRFSAGAVVEHDARSYYAELTELVNDAMPPMYRMKPYFWGEGPEE